MSRLFRRHHHQWWLCDATVYAPKERPESAGAFTLFTYVCRSNRSHTKQVRLDGHQQNTAEIIFERQREDQAVEVIPDVFKKAWGNTP